MADHAELSVIGWRERIDLPEWGVEGIIAKIDTGARTSAIHVANLKRVSDDRVRFEVVQKRTDLDHGHPVEATILRTSRVRSSNGQLQERFVVETLMRIGHVDRRIEVSLVCRRHMLCRMLVGRKSLEATFLVDPSARYILSRKTKRRGPRSKRSGRDPAKRKGPGE